jgi:hypothetical protein
MNMDPYATPLHQLSHVKKNGGRIAGKTCPYKFTNGKELLIDEQNTSDLNPLFTVRCKIRNNTAHAQHSGRYPNTYIQM